MDKEFVWAVRDGKGKLYDVNVMARKYSCTPCGEGRGLYNRVWGRDGACANKRCPLEHKYKGKRCRSYKARVVEIYPNEI